tara:strand:+ start:6064 stop:7236 length:1173 start_codon:yes stop_codon:yes gene_type:complete
MNNNYLFTSESVSEGHPDKICDQISDAIVDAYLSKSSNKDNVRVACETMVTTNKVIIAGEVRGPEISEEEQEHIARQVVKEIGYEQKNFHWQNFDFSSYLHEQSQDIAQGVDSNDSRTEGAGDQGIMFGYACTETKEFMPAAIQYSHQILKSLSEHRKKGKVPGILPDSKSQITLKYIDNKPIGCDNIVISSQHEAGLSKKNIFDYLYPIIEDSLPNGWMPREENIFINPTGKFEIGGPDGDAGLTGRKIIVDTYGGSCQHGGGAFSGKDPSKVDRSAAYAARYVAKNIVYAGLAERCTIQLSYAIGMVEPLSVYVNTHDTGKLSELEIINLIKTNFDLTPRGIREMLNLSNINYLPTAAYGHFGRESENNMSFTWEKTNKAVNLTGPSN